MSLIIGFLAVIGLVALDQWAKYATVVNLMEPRRSVSVIDGVFEFYYVENHGASFGMLQDQRLLFIIFTSVILVFMLVLYVRLPKVKRYTPLKVTMVLLFAGAVGNFIDRIRLGYVVDMLHFYWFEFPVFNIADICVVIASFLLVFLMLFYYKEEELDYKRLLGVGKNESTD